jgi:hypothetical protein
MNKNSILTLLLVINSTALCMNPEENNSSFFTILPTEVQNYLAEFLTFDDIETETEFIERSKVKKINSSHAKYYKHINENNNIFNNDIFPDLSSDYSSQGTLSAECPNKKKIALLELRCSNFQPKIVIVNTVQNVPLYTNTIAQNQYTDLAISRCATLLATIYEQHKHLTSDRREIMHYQIINTLEIKNINTNKLFTYTLPDNFMLPKHKEHHLIAFNKQGTHVIIHGTDLTKSTLSTNDRENNPTEHHILIPITFNQTDEIVPAKQLHHYFEQKMICKQLQ